MKDYYKILGVTKLASADEIKKAFRQLAREYHPDKTGNDPQKGQMFREINEAYETLGNEEKRASYDMPKNGTQTSNKNSSNKESGFTPNFDMNDFEKRFESFFGFSKSGEKVQKEGTKINTDAMFNSFFKVKK